jgi:hypothetical protein
MIAMVPLGLLRPLAVDRHSLGRIAAPKPVLSCLRALARWRDEQHVSSYILQGDHDRRIPPRVVYALRGQLNLGVGYIALMPLHPLSGQRVVVRTDEWTVAAYRQGGLQSRPLLSIARSLLL